MAQITLTDTGKYSVGGSVISGEQIASGSLGVVGEPLTLKNTALSLGQSVFSSDPKQSQRYRSDNATNAFDFGEVQTTGMDQPKWVLTCYFKGSEEEDMKDMGRLLFMCATKGYKELATATGNGFYDLIAYSKYGQREVEGEGTKTITEVNVRIKSFSVAQSADRKGFRVSLNMAETN